MHFKASGISTSSSQKAKRQCLMSKSLRCNSQITQVTGHIARVRDSLLAVIFSFAQACYAANTSA